MHYMDQLINNTGVHSYTIIYEMQVILVSLSRVYNELNDRTLSKLNSCVLVAESEQNLKSAVLDF